MRTEQPPRLQALLRMIQNKLRFLHKLPPHMLDKAYIHKLEGNLVDLSEILCYLMANPNADVRKSVVFCLVEIHSVVSNNQLF